jgi:hypothetical protein
MKLLHSVVPTCILLEEISKVIKSEDITLSAQLQCGRKPAYSDGRLPQWNSTGKFELQKPYKKRERKINISCLDDWLTVHRSITLVDLQLDAQNSYFFMYKAFIKILYMLPCSSSGGLHHNCIYSNFRQLIFYRVTIPEAACIQLRSRPPEDEQGNAQNM